MKRKELFEEMKKRGASTYELPKAFKEFESYYLGVYGSENGAYPFKWQDWNRNELVFNIASNAHKTDDIEVDWFIID